MDNLEELTSKARIERIKSKFELAKSYGSDQLTVPMPDLEALIAQLEAKNIRADACVNAFDGIETERFAGKSIGEFLTGEVRLNKAEPKSDGSFGFTFSGVAIQIMAEAFADQFKSSGAVNYLELLFDHSEVGPLTVTMQRVEGLTPAQKLAAVEAQLEAAQKERDELKELNCHFDLSIRKTEGVNEVLRSKLEAAERALIRPLPIGELVHRLEGQTYEKWFSESDVKDLRERAQKAEAALSAANEKLSKPVEFPDCDIGAVSHMAHWYSEKQCEAWVAGVEFSKKQIIKAGFTVEGE